MLATDPLALSVWWSKTAVDTLSTLQIPTKCATHNIYIKHFSFVFRPKSHIQSDKSYRKLLSKYGISYVFVHQVFFVVVIVCYTQTDTPFEIETVSFTIYKNSHHTTDPNLVFFFQMQFAYINKLKINLTFYLFSCFSFFVLLIHYEEICYEMITDKCW